MEPRTPREWFEYEWVVARTQESNGSLVFYKDAWNDYQRAAISAIVARRPVMTQTPAQEIAQLRRQHLDPVAHAKEVHKYHLGLINRIFAR